MTLVLLAGVLGLVGLVLVPALVELADRRRTT